MTIFEERETHLKLSTASKSRTIAAPWFLSGHGDPIQLPIPAGGRACFDNRNKVLHVRDNEKGIAFTATPSVHVRLDYAQNCHEVEFIDLEDPTKTLAGVNIIEGMLSFDDQKMFDFSNTEMFTSLCKLLASSVFNPWKRLPELKNEYSRYQCDLSTKMIHVNPEMKGIQNVDEQRSPLIRFRFESSLPLKCWNKDTREDDELPPGVFSAEVIESDHNTGDAQTVKVDGWNASHTSICTFHVPFQPLNQMIENGKGAFDNAKYRITFDPRVHTDLALKAVAEPNRSGFLSRLTRR